jgi:membrane-associated phospholipid phosphatase
MELSVASSGILPPPMPPGAPALPAARRLPLRARVARNERFLTALLLSVTLTVGFYLTDYTKSQAFALGTPFWSPSSGWDALITLAPGWVWAYLLYFPFCFAPLACRRLWDDIGAFRAAAAGFALQFAAALAVFWLFPSRMERPDFDVVGAGTWALSWVYRLDHGFNVFPSLHVANSVFVAALIWRWTTGAPRAAAWAACAAISLSTLLVKQHYLTDLPAGALLGFACFRLAFPPLPAPRA